MVRLIIIAFTALILGLVSVPSEAHAQFAQFYPAEAIAPTSISDDLPSPVAQLALGDSMFSFSGTRPTTLGVTSGKLSSCPNSPNCVSSQAPEADTEHFIAPLDYSQSPAETLATLKSVISSMDRTEIITEGERYLYAEFTSALMGFVDDVEFYLDDEAGALHVRSASRLGQSDLGVNRKRIEEIRAKLAAA